MQPFVVSTQSNISCAGHPGASSSTIEKDMKKLFAKQMAEFAFVMILSGTNDLDCNNLHFDAKKVAHTIMRMHLYAHSFGSPHRPVYTVLATIPGR